MKKLLILALFSVTFSQDCQEIEQNYLDLHSGEYTECEYDIDCMPVWGHCGEGLGDCHYAVNSSYLEGEVNELVDLWIQYQCMQWVCTCLELPYAVCNDGTCELAYCSEPNPAGCFETGCPEGYACIDDSNYCTASTCGCDEASDSWWCTEDCGGGTCHPLGEFIFGDINNDSLINILDVIELVNIILSLEDYNPLADMNDDGMVNVLDVIQIVNIILSN